MLEVLGGFGARHVGHQLRGRRHYQLVRPGRLAPAICAAGGVVEGDSGGSFPGITPQLCCAALDAT